ncbi:hypothetical protein LCGC14_0282780 [marine sediment metagenome]|uniref:Competence protein CoiA nuclease-like domain-containing protein n=1 Tax=marine sediment metagenome TaxID=412755 RepID=A0A0F9U0K9_9ZZZZ
MPLRAILDGQQIQAFDLAPNDWNTLKETYKKGSLVMPCCPRNAIPKTSKLGVQHFAHSRRGECTSAPETEDHLLLKSCIATAAQRAGWEVTTEHSGSTPAGEQWIADVYCSKGTAKVAIEVQWTPQVHDEYVRRTYKYTESGVRCVWLFRLTGSGHYHLADFPQSRELPYFGIRKSNGDYLVSQYDTPISDFVAGLLSGHVTWHPKPNETLTMRANHVEVDCWRCHKTTCMVTDIEAVSASNVVISRLPFTDKRAATWIAAHFDKVSLSQNGIGTICSRYSKTFGGNYISNGCVHCDALQGDFFLPNPFECDPVNGAITTSWVYDKSELELAGGWFLDGASSKWSF